MIGAAIAQRIASLLGQRFRGSGSILCFHSLAHAGSSPAGLVTLERPHFEGLLAALQEIVTFVPLQELVHRHLNGRSIKGLCAITFDDAYATVSLALPFLQAHELPATLFVTGEGASRGARFWWDRIEHLQSVVSAERWRAFEDLVGLPEEYRRGQPVTLGPLRPFRQWLLSTHRGRIPDHLERALASLEAEAGTATSQRSMTFAELGKLANSDLFDVGVHTVSHPVLPLLTEQEQWKEITACHDLLRDRLPRTQPILAIPFGLFDRSTLQVAKRAGMLAVLTLANRTLRSYGPGDPLPRFCLTRFEKPWKLLMRVNGVAERALWWRDDVRIRYPALPSPTS